MFRLERVRAVKGVESVEVSYGFTSLPRDRADAARLLGLVRGHWGIETGLHYVRDVTLGEDACRVRSGSAPEALAGLRNVVVCLLASIGAVSRAAATRRLAAKPHEAMALLRT